MDELDEIRKDATTARTLREGVPGQEAQRQEAARRLGAPDPEMGTKLRSQQPAPVDPRLSSNPTGSALRNQPPTQIDPRLASAATEPLPSPGEMRQSLGIKDVARAVPERNVPLGTPGGQAPMPGTISVDQGGRAGVVANPNINPAVRGGMSPEAEAFLKDRAATPGSSGVKSAATAAGEAAPAVAEAAPAVARTISGVARAAGPIGIGLGGLIEGQNVARVVQDPSKSKIDVATQGAESAAKVGGTYAGAALGAQAGAALGAFGGPAAPVTVPAGALIGGVAGGYLGNKGVQEGIAALRAHFGLDPAPPAATAAAPAAKPKADATAATAAPATPGQQTPASVQQVSTPVQNAASATSSSGTAGTIAGAAAKAAKTPAVNYELGKNAVEVFQPNGDRHVQLFDQDGSASSVPSNVFHRGAGAIAQYADDMQAAERRHMEDPTGQFTKQRLENEGRVATQEKANEGHVAGIRESIKQPVAIKGPMGDTVGLATNGPNGVQFQDVPKPKPPHAKAQADAKAWVQKGGDPAVVNQQLQAWGYPAMKF